MNVKATLAAAAATAVVVGGVGVGIAYADPTPSPSTSASQPKQSPQQQGAKKHGKARLIARAQHGEATVGGKKQTRVVVFQKGTVTAVTSGKVTVTSLDGFAATYVVNGDTRVRAQQEQKAVGDVKTSLRVRVLGSKDGSTSTAKRIVLLK